MLVLLILVACHPITIKAQVFISEVYPAPASGESEWVELCNPSEQAIDLSTHYLMDQLSTPSVLLTFANQSMNPLSALVVNIAGSKLNNAGDSVLLYSPNNQVIDQVSYGNATTGQSFSRLSSSQPLTASSPNPSLCLPQHFPPTPTPTPTLTPTPLPTPTPSPKPTNTSTLTPTETSTINPTSTFPADQFTSLIEVSEIMACPETGSSEWLELYNFSSSTVDLSGWYLLDAVNNKIDLSIIISPKSYELVEFAKAIINNSGDTLFILSPDNVIRWQTTLPACEAGQSFSLIAGQHLLGPPTPNSPNPVTSTTSTASTNSSPTNTSTTATINSGYSISSSLPPPTPVLLSSASTTEEPWPNELNQVLGDVDDLTLPKLFNSYQATISATSPDPSSPLDINPLPVKTRLALPALFGSSLGGLIMLSSGLLLAYVTWQSQLASPY